MLKPADIPVILGNSPSIKKIHALLPKIIESPAPLVIQGESGTGKELVAHAIHYGGQRKEHRIVAENCAALSERLLESELFGYRKGAFTGADHEKEGLFETANNGTLFLDEIAELPPTIQGKLLHAIEFGEIRRIGEATPRSVDVRLVAATNRDLLGEVEAGRFRQDLYYRLSVLVLRLPPLRERKEDIPLLAQHFLSDYSKRTGKSLPGLSQEVLKKLEQYSWPGNMRELRNEVERMAALVDEGKEITHELLSDQLRGIPVALESGESLTEAVQRIGRELIEQVLYRTEGSHIRAAKILQISPSDLQKISNVLGIPGNEDFDRTIIREIEFPPEHKQAGIAILQYFGEVINQKFPDLDVKVTIIQDGSMVRMIVETPEGMKIVVEKALYQYGLVATGRMLPEEFLENKLHIAGIENQLRLAHAQLENARMLVEIERTHSQERIGDLEKRVTSQDEEIQRLNRLLEKGLDYTAQIVQQLTRFQQTAKSEALPDKQKDELIEAIRMLLQEAQKPRNERKDLRKIKEKTEAIDALTKTGANLVGLWQKVEPLLKPFFGY